MRRLLLTAVSIAIPTLAFGVSAIAATQPILAGPWASNQEGYGHVKPARVYNGGDPTGLVTRIHWITWGHSKATGTGTATWVGPHQVVAEGRPQSARIVLFQLGTCHGRRAYDAVEWYFPQHGQHFNARQYINACTGAYYPRG
jgi:hypothetical protein